MGIDWREKVDRKLVHGAEDENKNRWRILGTRNCGHRLIRQGYYSISTD